MVIAIQLDLDTKRFTYRKWGGEQRCKPGDWLVDNDGDIYSVDRKVFAETYRKVKPGIYVKATPVWAEIATQSGSMTTREGQSQFNAGDYLVYTDEEGTDGYCMTSAKFKEMYEPDDSSCSTH